MIRRIGKDDVMILMFPKRRYSNNIVFESCTWNLFRRIERDYLIDSLWRIGGLTDLERIMRKECLE